MFSNKIVYGALLATALTATTASATEPYIASAHEANAIISEYRALRNDCVAAQGSERMTCFNALNKQNELYSSAKKYLSSDADAETSKVHLISVVQ